jgi:hypothetical protein
MIPPSVILRVLRQKMINSNKNGHPLTLRIILTDLKMIFFADCLKEKLKGMG